MASNILDALLKCDYPKDRFSIIAVNDHSQDSTLEILEKYQENNSELITILNRDSNSVERGKQNSLNEAIEMSDSEIILVFDADYIPQVDGIKKLVATFSDSEVGACMGRVVPYNRDKNILTRLLYLERAGGYQIDQQARYNKGYTPQYGGTNGGFRRALWEELGGFDSNILAEDTELTFRLYINNYKIAYVNDAVCYEESPATWKARAVQVKRWSRGHNQVMMRYFGRVLRDKNHTLLEKVDALMTLSTYLLPVLILLGQPISLCILWMNTTSFSIIWALSVALVMFNSFGNFAPFYEISTACVIDGNTKILASLPYLIFSFFYYMWFITLGFLEALKDKITDRRATWNSTVHEG